ncbi:unnamed protein product [Staurois parvus]|uniref:Cyclin-dependent kinase inhibitor domain-containing protein n=1 Tax=Staurois parvus TaxID=386267 RepID=A0ABN9E3Z2_9NEOB|nr:unnamed protein product [Staurois parvus]
MDSARDFLSQSTGCTEKVRRNLFGPVDHELLRADFEAVLKSTAEQARQRWNFDFVTETPLEGNYKWEKVDCAHFLHPTEANESDSSKENKSSLQISFK